MKEVIKKEEKEKSFTINPETWEIEKINYLYKLSQQGERTEFIKKSVEFYYDYLFYNKGFLVRMIENNFELCKHILRKVGNSRRLAFENDEKMSKL